MVKLPQTLLNKNSTSSSLHPYQLTKFNNTPQRYFFYTDNNIRYNISFSEFPYFDSCPDKVIEFSFFPDDKLIKSKNDDRLRDTIICAIDAFFIYNPDNILFFSCLKDDNLKCTSKVRMSLFEKWFRFADLDFVLHSFKAVDRDIENHFAIIANQNNVNIINLISDINSYLPKN